MPQEEFFLDSPAGQLKDDVKETKGRSRLGIIVTGVLGGSLVALYAVAAPFVSPALRKICLPFVPATTAQVDNVLTVLRARSGTLVDIGSGDGRIVSAEGVILQEVDEQKTVMLVKCSLYWPNCLTQFICGKWHFLSVCLTSHNVFHFAVCVSNRVPSVSHPFGEEEWLSSCEEESLCSHPTYPQCQRPFQLQYCCLHSSMDNKVITLFFTVTGLQSKKHFFTLYITDTAGTN